MKRLFVAVLAVVALAATGCGASCKDACQNLIDCATKAGIPAATIGTVSACETQCDAASCSGKSDLLKCLKDLNTCTDPTAFGTAASACVTANPGCVAL